MRHVAKPHTRRTLRASGGPASLRAPPYGGLPGGVTSWRAAERAEPVAPAWKRAVPASQRVAAERHRAPGLPRSVAQASRVVPAVPVGRALRAELPGPAWQAAPLSVGRPRRAALRASPGRRREVEA